MHPISSSWHDNGCTKDNCIFWRKSRIPKLIGRGLGKTQRDRAAAPSLVRTGQKWAKVAISRFRVQIAVRSFVVRSFQIQREKVRKWSRVTSPSFLPHSISQCQVKRTHPSSSRNWSNTLLQYVLRLRFFGGPIQRERFTGQFKQGQSSIFFDHATWLPLDVIFFMQPSICFFLTIFNVPQRVRLRLLRELRCVNPTSCRELSNTVRRSTDRKQFAERRDSPLSERYESPRRKMND